MENRSTQTRGATRPTAAAEGSTELLAAAALTGVITVYAALAVVVLLSVQHPRAWEAWLITVPAGLLVLSVALATPAVRRRREIETVRERRHDSS